MSYKGLLLASLTIENYLKTIFSIGESQSNARVATGTIADSLGVSPGTVTSMLKTLSESGLAEYAPYEGVSLTNSGRALALRVIRRHRLIESFLVKTLGLNWDEVHDEAENLEHAVSDFLVDRMDQFLGHPETDPHGAPIPKRDGSFKKAETVCLTEIEKDTIFRLNQVKDQSPEFLKFLTNSGLSIGTTAKLVDHCAQSGTVTLQIGDDTQTFSLEMAKKFRVTEI